MENKELLEGDKLIKEFMGYVQSEYPVQLHSKMSGFGSGYRNAFIKKEQYDKLVGHFNKMEYIEIDKFYENNQGLEYKYIFDGTPEHLFLCAFKNRSTKLDWKSKKVLYHESLDASFPVLLKIESLGYRWELGMNSSATGYACKIWSIGGFESNTPAGAVWFAICEFIKWYNNYQLINNV